MKGSTRQIPGASFIWSCFVQNRAFILCPLKCDFRPLDIAWQPCVRLPRNIATRSRFYSRRSANTYPSLESDHKNDPYHGKTGQHALTSNKIFFSKSPVFAVHRGIVRHLPAEHKIQSLPVRIPPSPPKKVLKLDGFKAFLFLRPTGETLGGRAAEPKRDICFQQMSLFLGAADGSRTHLCSLGSCRSTDEL